MDNIAVVILNFNGVNFLKQFLPRVIEFSAGCQIVVIDNHSNDNSVSFLQQEHPDVQLISLEKNHGFSGGYNRGLIQVKADNFILLNSDVEVTPGWAHTLNTYMGSNPQVAICQPKIRSYDHRHQFDYAGAAGGYLDLLAYPFCRGRVFNHIERDQEQYGDTQDIFWAGGACFCIRASIFHELGGFDEEFFAHMEEIDLCWRSQRLGYKTACVTDCVVYHVGGGTLKSGNPLKTYLNFRNGLQLLVKNSSISALIWKLPMRILLDLVAALRFLLLGNWSHVNSVLKAIVVFVATFPRTWRKRSQFNAPFHSRLGNIILVWEYFIRKRQTYQELPNTD